MTRLQSDEEREAEDLTVARFYRDSGNLQAAYLRVKDALTSGPEEPDAQFLMGQIAQKMNKRDEALKAFQAYLRLDPEGEHAKQAKNGIAELGGAGR